MSGLDRRPNPAHTRVAEWQRFVRPSPIEPSFGALLRSVLQWTEDRVQGVGVGEPREPSEILSANTFRSTLSMRRDSAAVSAAVRGPRPRRQEVYKVVVHHMRVSRGATTQGIDEWRSFQLNYGQYMDEIRIVLSKITALSQNCRTVWRFRSAFFLFGGSDYGRTRQANGQSPCRSSDLGFAT